MMALVLINTNSCALQVAVLTIIDLVAKVGFGLYFLINFGKSAVW
jgi:hypothetical protein